MTEIKYVKFVRVKNCKSSDKELINTAKLTDDV